MVEVYKHTNTTNGKSYIGYSIYGMEFRYNQHLDQAFNGKGYKFHQAIRKHGASSFTHEILAEVETVVEAKSIEEF